MMWSAHFLLYPGVPSIFMSCREQELLTWLAICTDIQAKFSQTTVTGSSSLSQTVNRLAYKIMLRAQ